MLVLFETPAGFALFRLHDEGKLKKIDKLQKHFEDLASAKQLVSLHEFSAFENTAEALSAAASVIEGKLGKGLRRFLRKSLSKGKVNEKLAVMDPKLAGAIKEKLNIDVVSNAESHELFRCIRSQLQPLLAEHFNLEALSAMELGLAHSLSRYKLKFSPDRVDAMIVAAYSTWEDLSKELNTYAMRVKEWYSLHFPELMKIVTDNIQFAQVVRFIGIRENALTMDLEEVVEEELVEVIRQAVRISMGSDIADDDMEHIKLLCDQVIEIAQYREELESYIRNRMQAIAPNLTILLGELLGAKLITHAGSLINLAKYPASTVQIVGAEKAYFRAVKTFASASRA